MRRIVFGLLFAALVYWSCTALGRGTAAAGPERASDPDLAQMLGNSPTGAPTGAAAGAPTKDQQAPSASHPADAGAGAGGAGNAPLSAAKVDGAAPSPAPVADAELERAFQILVTAIEAGDQAARSQALRLLSRDDLAQAHRTRLRTLLGLDAATLPPGALDDIDAVLAKLGDNNAFLQSNEGRALGHRAVELLAGLDDERAVQKGTQLLDRCMRGSIERKDKQAIAFVDEAYKAYRPFADRVLCDPANLTGARSYTVAKGDSLAAIAARFRKEGVAIDEGSLAILNRIHNMNAIRVGQRIRVPMDPLHAVVEKRSYLMAVYLGERMLRLYWVGHGEDGKTPVAEFTVAEKLKDPDWDSPRGRIPFGSPENILGRYFVKFDHPSYVGFGAHGTPMPETIGTQSSAGCIRMLDADIEELFRLLPRKAKVEIRDSH
jgi:hypothetical protein